LVGDASLWLLIHFAKLSGLFERGRLPRPPTGRIVRRRWSIVLAVHGAPNASGLRGWQAAVGEP